jgi:hypothetical protein
MTLRSLSDLATSLPLQTGSEEIQVLRFALLNTVYAILRVASNAWKAECVAKRKRKESANAAAAVKAKRSRLTEGPSSSAATTTSNENLSSSLFEDLLEDAEDDPFSDLLGFTTYSSYSSSSSSSNNTLSGAKAFLPQRDTESFLRIVKHFGLILGEHRDFNYANGTVSVGQYLQALIKCNKAYPFEDLLAMVQE